MALEEEKIEILSGIRNGLTTGAPIAIRIRNKDVRDLEDYSPRPGHADLPGCLKYGFKDIHLVAERASARETVVRVALGTIAGNFLENFGIELVSHTVKIGEVSVSRKYTFQEIKERRLASSVYCVEKEAEKLMIETIKEAETRGDTVGGITEVRAKGILPGLGSFVHHDRRIEFRIGGALLAIPGVKGIEIGDTQVLGSLNNDSISVKKGYVRRATNHAGGIEGGMTNGEEIIIKLKVKPVPSLRMKVKSVDLRNFRPSFAPILRGDTCVVPSVGIIAEKVLALELTGYFLEKFGGDSLKEVRRNWLGYMKSMGALNRKNRKD
jgi:chorismate synthase